MSEPYIGALFSDPANMARLNGCESTGGVVYATSEGTIASQVVNLNGAIGYKMDDSSENTGEFALLFPATTIDGHTVRTARWSDPDGLLACVTEQTFDPLTLDLNTAAGYTNPDCYPLTQVVYMQVPRDYPTSDSSTGFVTLTVLQDLFTSPLLDGWFNSSMFVRAPQLPFLQAALVTALNAVTSGGDTLLVTSPLVWVMSSSLQRSGFAVAWLGGCVTLLTLCVFVRYNRDTRLRASSPLIMAISLVGILCMYMSVIFLVLSPSFHSCAAMGWTLQLGYTLTFAPLVAKSYRIYRIFGRKRLRVLRITDRHLLLFVAVMVAVDAVLLTASSLVTDGSPMQPVSLTVTLSSDMRQHVYSWCQPVGRAYVVFTIQTIIKCVMLVVGVLLAFATRGVLDDYNESKSIAFAVYNLVLVLLLIVPITIVVNPLGDTFVILLLFLIAWIATFTLGVLFFSKLVPFLTTSQSPTSPIVRRTSAGQHFSFLSLNHIPSSAALLPYLAALDKHTTECKRLLARLRHKEGLPSTPPPTKPPTAIPQLPGQLRTSGSGDRSGQVVPCCGEQPAQQQIVAGVRGAGGGGVNADEVRFDAEVVVGGSVEAEGGRGEVGSVEKGVDNAVIVAVLGGEVPGHGGCV